MFLLFSWAPVIVISYNCVKCVAPPQIATVCNWLFCNFFTPGQPSMSTPGYSGLFGGFGGGFGDNGFGDMT